MAHRKMLRWIALLVAVLITFNACNSFHHGYLQRLPALLQQSESLPIVSTTDSQRTTSHFAITRRLLFPQRQMPFAVDCRPHCSHHSSSRRIIQNISGGSTSSRSRRPAVRTSSIPTNSTVNGTGARDGAVGSLREDMEQNRYDNVVVTATATPISQMGPRNVGPVQAVVDAVLEARDMALYHVDDAEINAAKLLIESEVARDRKKTSMVRINILTVLFYSTLGAVMPYLPVYYRRIGVSDAKIGFLGAITPAVTFLVSPLWGALADTSGSHNTILLLTFLGSVITRCSLALGSGTDAVWLGMMVALTAVLYAPVKPLLDSAILSRMDDKTQYGKSRLFGQVGFGLASFLMSPLLGSNMRMIFAAQALIAIPTAFMMTTFNARKKEEPAAVEVAASATTSSAGKVTTAEKEKAPQKEPLHFKSAMMMVFKDPRVLVFFFVVFTLGISSGIIENYAYVRISEVAKSGNVLGYCRFFSSLAGGPMFWLSGQVIKKIGTNAVLGLSLVSYALRFLIYASMRAGWHALPAEAMRGLTFALFWSASTCYVYDISPAGLSATMLGILNGMYGGLGQSLGALLGGQLVQKFGIQQSFFACSGGNAIMLAVFSLFQLLQKTLAMVGGQQAPDVVTIPSADSQHQRKPKAA